MALADFATGAQGAIQRMLAERALAQKQALETRFKLMQEARMQREMDLRQQDMTMRWQDAQANRENQRLTTLGTLNEALGPGEYGDSEGLRALADSPYGSLLTKQEIQAEPDFTGPTQPGEATGEQRRKGGALYTKRPTRTQQKDLEATANLERDDQRAIEAAAETSRHNKAVEGDQATARAEASRHNRAMEGAAMLRAKNTGAGATSDAQAEYSNERTQRSLDAVRALKGKVGGFTAGAGSMLAGIPGTDARNFQAELNTLKSNIAFSELAAMRAASKTGGALGAISEKELALLESTLGALDAGQSPANLRAQLEKIEQSLTRWQMAHPGRTAGAGGTVPMIAPDGRPLMVPAEKVAEMEALGAKRR